MIYELPNSVTVDLSKVYEVSEIRDYGYDDTTVELSLVQFTIRLKNGTSIPVKKHYHYSDWSIIIKELRKIRQDLITHWEEYKATK
jgi:hypothetical protein